MGGRASGGAGARVDTATQAAEAAASAEAASRVAHVLVIAHHSVMAKNITAAARPVGVRQRGKAAVTV